MILFGEFITGQGFLDLRLPNLKDVNFGKQKTANILYSRI